MELTIGIPFYNGHETLDQLIRSVPRKFPVIIVDDQSDEPLLQDAVNKRWERPEGSDIRVIRMEKKGYFSGACNRIFKECCTDVLILNQDTWFDNELWIAILEHHRNEYAYIGERIRGNHPSFGDLGYIHGTFAYFRRDMLESIGFLNESLYPLWGSTAEYQWRAARKNFLVLPLKSIPGFNHKRPQGERYGSSIKQLLEKEPQNESILIRTPPLLSVVVPVFNYGRYLSDCIASLIGGQTSLGLMSEQTIGSCFEIVIVDDASTDNSLEIIKNHTDISKGIRAYHLEKNVGTARALNFGIERCYGKYITFLSADDMREPDSLERLVEVCEQNPHSFAYDDVWLFNKHERMKKWPFGDYDFESLIWQNHVHAGIVFPRAAWAEVGGYPPIMGDGREDWAFNIALGIRGWCGVHLKNYGYLYRREGQNRTEKNTTEYHRERFLGKIMTLFPEIYKGNRPMACCGKGSNSKSNKSMTSRISSVRSPFMAENNVPPVGREPMESIEYLGGQMNFTITGDVTGAKYTFGKDRPKGWVFKSDVGNPNREDKLGFLSKRENGKWLYRLAGTSQEAAPEPAAGTEIGSNGVGVPPGESQGVEGVGGVTVGKHGAVGMSEMLGTLTVAAPAVVEQKVPTPNPIDLTVEELKSYADKGLTKDQWEAIYKIEMANRNRKGAVAWLEQLLADWTT